ncbi:MAG TPA: energy-coupling factor transporter transmembrane protein EcfT [Desulfuromonadales bacterium]
MRTLINDITLGRFVPGNSFLHRLDPRLKLAGLPILVIAAFAAHTGEQRLALALLAGALILLAGGHWRFFLRGLWALRWLFLCTVLLHLLFSPGRTLFGNVWLSLDGLFRGLLVCEQLALAVLFSSLLTLSTSPSELAAAISSLLWPFGRFGMPVRELSLLLLLSLHFIPILREEALAQLAASRATRENPARDRLLERGQAVGRMLAPLLLRLVDRADGLALAVAAGKPVVEELPLPPWWRVRPAEAAFLLALILCLVFIFGALP